MQRGIALASSAFIIVSDHWISGLTAESSDFRYCCPFCPVFFHDSLLTAFIAIFMIYSCFVSLEINDSQIFNYNNSCFFLPFKWPNRKVNSWPVNNCLHISTLRKIKFYLYVMETTLLCENGRTVPRAVRESWFDMFGWSKEQWSNNKTIILV